jgi:ParG
VNKPTFKLPPAPRPLPPEADQWVSERPPEPSPRPPAAKLARLTIDLPADLHARFKATCALKGTRMIDEVRRFIEDWTQKNR